MEACATRYGRRASPKRAEACLDGSLYADSRLTLCLREKAGVCYLTCDILSSNRVSRCETPQERFSAHREIRTTARRGPPLVHDLQTTVPFT